MGPYEIQKVGTLDTCREFVCDFYKDPEFSHPMLTNEEQLQKHLTGAMEKPETHHVLGGIYGIPIGWYVFFPDFEGGTVYRNAGGVFP